MTRVHLDPPAPMIDVVVDGRTVRVPRGSTILDALRSEGIETPTICHAPNLTPANACRVCVVEVDGARTLVPACSRRAEDGMAVHTDTPRVRRSRRLVLEFLASSADVSLSGDVHGWIERYEAEPERFGAVAPGAGEAIVDNDLYVRDLSRCVLCYKCVDACGVEAQNTFAITVAGRGADARVATEFEVPLPESACVYCGNCIGVCPTGALMFRAEHELREAGEWDEGRQTVTTTICPYCGVGCDLEVRVQDERIVRVTSPSDSGVTGGHLCIKGRFGFEFAQARRRGGPEA